MNITKRQPAVNPACVCALDDVLSAIYKFTESNSVLLTLEHGEKISILTGVHVFREEVSNEWRWPELRTDGQTTFFSRNIKKDPRLAGHPIQKCNWQIKSVAAFAVKDLDTKNKLTLTLFEPGQKIFDDIYNSVLMQSACEIIVGLIDMLEELGVPFLSDDKVSKHPAANVLSGFRESHMQTRIGDLASPEPTARFLLDTLIKQKKLHSRDQVSYITLRRRRGGIKPYQVDAMSILKHHPAASFIDEIAAEFCAAMTNLSGIASFKSVVPIPGGSSGPGMSFSERLAEAIGRKLGIPAVNALTRQQTPAGRSHPKKSAKLQQYAIQELPSGPTLLVDDIATSGRHLELGLKTLATAGVPATAIAWIGA